MVIIHGKEILKEGIIQRDKKNSNTTSLSVTPTHSSKRNTAVGDHDSHARVSN